MQNSGKEGRKAATDEKDPKMVSLVRSSRWFFQQGMQRVEDSQFEKALLFVRRASDMKPGNREYHFNMAGILAAMEEYGKSNQCLRRMLRSRKTGMADCYYGMGCNYFDMEHYASAVSCFEKYLRLEPEGLFSSEACRAVFHMTMEGMVPFRASWRRVIGTAVSRREKTYARRTEYLHELEWIWLHLVYVILNGKVPVIRHVQYWAVFLEYLYCCMHRHEVVYHTMAAKYGMTDTALRRKIASVLRQIK